LALAFCNCRQEEPEGRAPNYQGDPSGQNDFAIAVLPSLRCVRAKLTYLNLLMIAPE